MDPSQRTVTLSENLRAADNNGIEDGVVYNTYRFAFDRVYPSETPQHLIYEESARAAVSNVLQGYNASIIAFGQTGAGKTHTMTGSLAGDERGIIPRAVDDVFSHIQGDTGERCKFLVRASYLQIYNEVISDLLKPESTNLSVREDKRRGVHVEGLSEWVVRTPADVYTLMERGAASRATGATKLNELSSRSHAIFMLIVEKSTLECTECDANVSARAWATAMGQGAKAGGDAAVRQTVRVGKLNLVDLAGSERVHLTGAKGKRLEESKKINQSLSALGNVIAALTDPKGKGQNSGGRTHIPYRDSKLTRILEDSLGGNCKTTFMAMISPAVEAFSESLSTLKFAHRAKCIKNAPRVNEDVDHRTLLRKYEKELRKLRAELQSRGKDLVDKRLVLQLEEARRREQADKIAAISALERQSAEIARQKAAMAALQHRIESMQSQLLIGGQRVEDMPAFQTLLAKEQERIRGEYEHRVVELEQERERLQVDRAAAERLKNLLMKQREVMVALTQRLNERDDEVIDLRKALADAESRAKIAEDGLDSKMAELIAVRKSVVNQHRSGIGSNGLFNKDNDGLGHGDDESWSIAASPGRGKNAAHYAPSPGKKKNLCDRTNTNAVATAVADGGGGNEKMMAQGPVEVNTHDFHHHGSSTGGSTTSRSNSTTDEDEEIADVPVVCDNDAEKKKDGKPDGHSIMTADALLKERHALRSILQDKVLRMVKEVGKSVGELQCGESVHPTLERQVDYLRKLVAATVSAMEVDQDSHSE